jgi:pyruvate formate lyase activating enzyme
MEEALLWNTESGKTRCELCAWRCLIPEGKVGLCRVRENKKGRLYSKNFGKIIHMTENPIEKAPMFHFHPGSEALFLASFGCNMKCKFCINADMSQKSSAKVKKKTPEDIIKYLNEKRIKLVVFTYTEPTVNFEFAFKVARLAKRYNIKTVFVTNGYMTSDAIKKIGKYLDAVTVDIKASGDPEFYEKYTGIPDVVPIFDALKNFRKHRVSIEISNLVVPEIGDSKELNRELLYWIINNLDSSIPYHLTTFMPAYKMEDRLPTSIDKLEEFASDAEEIGLRYIYIDGQSGFGRNNNTYCYNCGELVIERATSTVKKLNLVGDRCPNCGFKIDVAIE